MFHKYEIYFNLIQLSIIVMIGRIDIIVEIHLFGSHLNIWKLSLFYQMVMVLLESTVGNVSA